MKSIRIIKTIKYFIVLVVLLLSWENHFGQSEYSDIYEIMNNTSIVQFSELQKIGNEYFVGKDKGRGSGYKQWKRWEYNMENHLTPDGKITNFTARNIQAYQKYFGNPDEFGVKSSKTTYGTWEFIGASYYNDGYGWSGGMGRVNCVAFHPTDQYTFYAGAPAGGLWKTTNGGGTWTCLTDGMPRIGIAGIVVHPNDPDIIYILTGDGDGNDTYSIGVLKTINGGINWQYTGLIFDAGQLKNAYKLLMHPTNTNILYAALTDGIRKTIDGGDTWTNTLEYRVYDVEFKPNDPTIMYASTHNGEFHRSIDSGDNWDQIFSGIPANATRIAIGVSDAVPDNVYLLCGPVTGPGQFKGFYISVDAGLIFLPRSISPNILGGDIEGQDNRDQSGYDLALVVSDSDPNLLITGGINAWRSTTGGISWSLNSHWNTKENPVGYTHADIHALEVNPLNNYIYCGSDGGLFKSTNFGDTWEDLSEGLEISQFYFIAGSESDVNLIIGGTQDNGVNKLDTSSIMLHILGADGVDCVIDHSDPLIYYCFLQYGEILYKTINGGQWFSNITPNIGLGPLIIPLAMDPTNSNILYCGYHNVMKTTNGGSDWSNVGADGRRGIAIGKNNPDRVYAISYDYIHHSNNGGSFWTVWTLPNLNPRSIVVDPANSLHVYITYANYFGDEKVYESWNGGQDWTNISGSLPDVPVYCIAYEEGSAGGVYIGTDIGVFYRDQNLSDWIPFGNGLPTVMVYDLDIHYGSGTIRAGTHGRGIWTSPLYSSCPSYYYLNQINDPSNPNYTGYQFYEAAFYISSSRIITGGIGTDVTYKSNGDVVLYPGFEVTEGSEFRAMIGPCTAKSQTLQDSLKIKQSIKP